MQRAIKEPHIHFLYEQRRSNSKHPGSDQGATNTGCEPQVCRPASWPDDRKPSIMESCHMISRSIVLGKCLKGNLGMVWRRSHSERSI